VSNSRNIHGRRRGRGIRPWLLTAKLIGVICFVGGLGALAALAWGSPDPDASSPDPVTARAKWKFLVDCAHWILVPGTIGGAILAIVAGFCLWLQMPRRFLRMRWFQIKIALVVVLVPTFHLWGRSTALELHEALDKPARLSEVRPLWDRLAVIFLLAFLAMLLIVWVGRIKPRLGQRYGKAETPKAETPKSQI
jgi:small-conductance mechanosensitive channel